MVKFQGEISKICKNEFVKKIKIYFFLCFFIPCFFVSIPFFILAIISDWIYILETIIIFVPFLAFLPVDDKSMRKLIPDCVYIEDGIIISSGNNFKFTRRLSQVNKIVDYGKWYHIDFKVPNKNQSFICQKDLIVSGSIEEFENIFNNKIVRKIKN